MKKTYKLENVCCANCAAKIETEINRLAEVDSASIAFMTQRLILTSSDHKSALPKIQKIISKIEKKGVVVYE